jgi:hypothetical protein
MGWSIGFDSKWNRDIGYGVPAFCDHPGCGEKIDRGLSYVCGGEPYGGDCGCGLYFCSKHLSYRGNKPQQCSRCLHYRPPFNAKPDTPQWLRWKLCDSSWREWRNENPEEVKKIRQQLKDSK